MYNWLNVALNKYTKNNDKLGEALKKLGKMYADQERSKADVKAKRDSQKK